MDATVRNVAIGAALAGLAAVGVVVSLKTGRDGRSLGPTSPPGANQPDRRPRAVPVDARWPIFRGEASLTGQADGNLSLPLQLQWRRKLVADPGPTAGASAPVVGDGRVFVGTDDGTVVAMDLATGQPKWTAQADAAVDAPPLLHAGRVYVGSRDTRFYCLDARTGEVLWKRPAGGEIEGGANVLPAADGNGELIVFGCYDQKVYALDSQTGRPVWTLDAGDYVVPAPAVSNGRLAIGSCGKNLYVGAPDGQWVGRLEVGQFVVAPAALAEGVAYFGDFRGVFRAVDLTTMQENWRVELAREGDADVPIRSPATVWAARVCFGADDGVLRCLDTRTGQELWRVRGDKAVTAGAVEVGGRLVVAGQDGRLRAVAAADGEELWRYDLGVALASSPAVAGGWVIVHARDGAVYAFAPPAEPRRGE